MTAARRSSDDYRRLARAPYYRGGADRARVDQVRRDLEKQLRAFWAELEKGRPMHPADFLEAAIEAVAGVAVESKGYLLWREDRADVAEDLRQLFQKAIMARAGGM